MAARRPIPDPSPPEALPSDDLASKPSDSHGERTDEKSRERARERAIDAELISRASTGDQRAFRDLVGRHQRRAHAVSYGMLRNAEDAREVVQEAFLRVYKHLHEFEGQASFSTWLYRIVVNLSIDQIRKRSPGRRIELEDHTDLDSAPEELLPTRGMSDPHGALDRKRKVMAMQTALDQLPEYHRAVILLRELDGQSYEEMAQTLEVAKGTIMSRLFHARKKMQKLLRESLGDEVPEGDGDEEPDEA